MAVSHTEPVCPGSVGIWSLGLRFGEAAEAQEAARRVEQLGYRSLWVPGGQDSGLLSRVEGLLDVTSELQIATSVLSIWAEDWRDIAAQAAGLGERFPARFLLGVGVSHPSMLVAQRVGAFSGPIDAMSRFLDTLDEASIPVRNRVLAALGPRMLCLAGRRSLGAHTNLMPVKHTEEARQLLGKGPYLAPVQLAVLGDDESAKRRAMDILHSFLGAESIRASTYRKGLRRIGFDDSDCEDGISERLLDALIVRGPTEAVADRVSEHLEAGADHVAVHLVASERNIFLLDQWEALAHSLRERGLIG